MYGLETIVAMNAATPAEINAKRVKAVRKYVQSVGAHEVLGNAPTAFVVAKTIGRILRRRKFA